MTKRDHFDVRGQSVIIAGGSKGLGRELALQLTSQGANVTIVARTKKILDDTHQAMLARVQRPDQYVHASVLDLTHPAQVEQFVANLSEPPSILFCVAGGTADEIGFFVDISCEHIKTCMERNYLTAAYISHAILKRWVTEPSTMKTPRHIVFTASTAAFVSLPGYAAYTPTKTATRALADSLRQEVLLYKSQQNIQIHCTFPGTIYTESFLQEQRQKPQLLKELEGSQENGGGLSPARVAEITIAGLKNGRYFITMDGDTALLLNNMRGPSPRDYPIWDWLLGIVVSLIWPLYRIKFDRTTQSYGKKLLEKPHH